jgi:hypothetical protein
MTRFHTVAFNDLTVVARPRGWSRFWLFKGLPYRTGDDISLVVTIKGHPKDPGLSQYINVNVARRSGSDIGGSVPLETLDRQEVSMVETTQEQVYRFKRISDSGEYEVEIAFWTKPPNDNYRATRREHLVTLQIVVDYKTWAVLIGILVALAISGVWNIIEWLIGLVS